MEKSRKINILVLFGTRPEAIKLAPIILDFKKYKDLVNLILCVTEQHREMLDQVLDFFEIIPDLNLGVMKKNQSLSVLSFNLVRKLESESIIEKNKIDLILVQGDTTSAFISSLIAYYKKVKIGHVEAGLRTNDKYNPFPEEINRQLISRIADYHFAPTIRAKENLLKENINNKNILVVGNTIVDALMIGIRKLENKNKSNLSFNLKLLEKNKRIILVTGHRRESFGESFKNICLALKYIAENNKDTQIIYPVHLNPNVKNPVYHILKGVENVILTKPLDYPSFIWLMHNSYLIITDSGGVQEEAPTLGKPVLVIRKKTEREESLNLNISKLVGTDKDSIIRSIQELIDSKKLYEDMVPKINPYGDGKASERIVNFILGKKYEEFNI